MPNDYSKFFYTYEAVEPPKYTKLNLDKPIKSNFVNPYFKNPKTSRPATINYIFNQTQEASNDSEANNPGDIITDFSSLTFGNTTNSLSYTTDNKYTNSVYNLFNSNQNKRTIADNIYNAVTTEMGWNDLLVSAMLGNVMQESSFDLGASNSGSSARGLFLMLNSTHSAFKRWDDNHPEYKLKYPDEYVRQALYIADAFNRHDTSVIFHEDTKKLKLLGKLREAQQVNQQGWTDWNSGNLSDMSNAFRRMWCRSSAGDKITENKRYSYSTAMYNMIKGGKNALAI